MTLRNLLGETSTVVGIGDRTLSGTALANARVFSDGMSDGDTVRASIVDRTTGDTEIGIYTYRAGPSRLEVSSILLAFGPSASSPTSPIPFLTGTKDVFSIADAAGIAAEATSAVSTHNAVTTAHGISAFGATLVDDVDAAAARTTLGAETTGAAATALTSANSYTDTAVALRQPSNANLTALAAQTGAADRVPYFTALATMALATLTSYGQTLIATVDAAAARLALGISAFMSTLLGASDAAAARATLQVETLLAGIFGPGVDGSLTVGANTTLQRDGFYQDLTITPGFVLTLDRCDLYVSGTLDLRGCGAGSIISSLPGGGGNGTAAGVAGGAGSVVPNYPASVAPNNRDGSQGAAGGAGGTAAGVIGGSAAGVVAEGGGPPGTGSAVAGGAGGLGASGAGAAAGIITATGTATGLRRPLSIMSQVIRGATIAALIPARGGIGGGGGGGDGTIGGGGGGGGAGGNGLRIFARTILVNGSTGAGVIRSVSPNGGAGGSPAAGNRGGGGGGYGGGGAPVIVVAGSVSGGPVVNAIRSVGGNGGNGGNGIGTGLGGRGGAGASSGPVCLTVLSTGLCTAVASTVGGNGAATPVTVTGSAGGAGGISSVSLP